MDTWRKNFPEDHELFYIINLDDHALSFCERK
jgi:hypothetical protein